MLLLPWVLFGSGIWIVFRTESEVRIQYERAHDHWRSGEYLAALQLYRRIVSDYPDSDYAPEALWEVGSIEYINLYRIDQASRTLREIVDTFPTHARSGDALMRLAEIYELDFKDSESAISLWEQLLDKSLQPEKHDEVMFRLGNAWFHMADLERARKIFGQLLDSPSLSRYYRQEITVRLGMILQLQQMHGEAIPFFEDALGGDDCGQCRLAAQLGLIESYEFLGDLDTALEVAANIDELPYSGASKEELLKRLADKQRFYNPTKWTGPR